MNRSRMRAVVSIVLIGASCALVGCGGGGSGSGGDAAAPMPTPAPGPSSTSLEGFVRDLIDDDPSAPAKDINDVQFNNEVQDNTFNDVFPA